MSNLNSGWFDRQSRNGIRRLNEYRSPYMRDECRVVHSFGFRRLQGKTQILGTEQGDFHRNRMTHSIEVASISRSIASYLKNICNKNKNRNRKLTPLMKRLDLGGVVISNHTLRSRLTT